jgi:peptidoglycan/xylan/chitin deacetylase (PgdA/CDA1 family)
VASVLVVGAMLWPSPSAEVQPPAQASETAGVIPPVIPRANCEAAKCLALTFDDGPDPLITPQILDILKNHNVHATFFVMGKHVSGNEALLQRMHAEGHEIGNHSWDHPYFTRISLDQVHEQIDTTQKAIIKAGVPAPRLFRPPYGDVNETVLTHIPLTVVRWNIDPEDWHPKRQAHLLEHMANYARPGGVVVMHDTEVTTLAQLDELLSQLESQQYTLTTAGDVLGVEATQPGLYFSRFRIGL